MMTFLTIFPSFPTTFRRFSTIVLKAEHFPKIAEDERRSKGPGKRGHIVADTLLPMMFLGLRKLGNICCGHKMFLNKIRNIFCVRNKARAGKWGNICIGNDVSATMCPRLPGPQDPVYMVYDKKPRWQRDANIHPLRIDIDLSIFHLVGQEFFGRSRIFYRSRIFCACRECLFFCLIGECRGSRVNCREITSQTVFTGSEITIFPRDAKNACRI